MAPHSIIPVRSDHRSRRARRAEDTVGPCVRATQAARISLNPRSARLWGKCPRPTRSPAASPARTQPCTWRQRPLSLARACRWVGELASRSCIEAASIACTSPLIAAGSTSALLTAPRQVISSRDLASRLKEVARCLSDRPQLLPTWQYPQSSLTQTLASETLCPSWFRRRVEATLPSTTFTTTTRTFRTPMSVVAWPWPRLTRCVNSIVQCSISKE